MSHYKLLVEGETRRLNTQDVGYERLLQEVVEMSGGQTDLVLGYFNPDREWVEITCEADFLTAVQTSSPKSLVRIMATKSDATVPPAMTASIISNISTDRSTVLPPSTNQQEKELYLANQIEESVSVVSETTGVDVAAVVGEEEGKGETEKKQEVVKKEEGKEGETGVGETARTLPDILTGEIMPFMMSARSRSRKQHMDDSEDDDGFLVVDDVTDTNDPYDDAGEHARYAQQRAEEEKEYEHQVRMEQSLLDAARELQRLSMELSNTLATLDKRNDDLVDLTHKIKNLEAEKTELESAHNTTQETLATLQSDHATAKTEIDRFTSLLDQANTDTAELQSQIEEKIETIRSMEEKVKNLEEEIEKRESAMSAAIENYRVEMEEVHAAVEREKSLLQGMIGEAKNEIESLRAEVGSAQASINEVGEEAAVLSKKLESVMAQNQANSEIISDQTERISLLEKEIDRVMEQRDGMEGEIKNLTEQLRAKEDEIAGVRSDLESIRVEAEGHKHRVNELEGLLAAANGANSELGCKVEDLESRLADMTEQHDLAERDLQSAVVQIKSRDTARATVEGEARRVGEVLRKTEEELSRTKRQLEMQQKNSHEWPRQLLEMQNTLRRERERADSYEAKWRAANGVSGAVTDMEGQLKRAEEKAASATQRLAEVEEKLKSANEQVAVMTNREGEWKRKLEDTTKAVVRAVKQASEYQDQLRQAQQQIPPQTSTTTPNPEISALRTQLSAAVSRADAAELRQVELDRLVRELRAEIDSMVRTRPVTRPVNLFEPDPVTVTGNDAGASGLVGDVDAAESQMEETCADVRDTVCVTVNEERNSLMTYIEEVATSIEQEEGPQNLRSLLFSRPIPTISGQIRQEGVQISDVCQKTLEAFDTKLTDCLDTHRAMLLGSRAGPGANGSAGDVARLCTDEMGRMQKEVLDHVVLQVGKARERVDGLTMEFYKHRQD
eukprot:comp24123_c1_seq1/m.43758 comp24123_c1_seq1/g.43758  ORF comp24123_c1_seq1/g.43758 comp24123_c1_seq1/m.43758 type:complete len:959 (-) comp24123_c1_seq1:138-3014(-)